MPSSSQTFLYRSAAQVTFLIAGVYASAGPPNPSAIVKTTTALYANARTFRGSEHVYQSGKTPKGQYSFSVTMQVIHTSPNKVYIHQIAKGTGIASKLNRESISVSDGKTIYNYLIEKKIYTRSPAPPSIPTLDMAMLLPKLSNLKLIGSRTVQGVKAYVIEGMPPIPANIPPQVRAKIKPVEFAIGVASHLLLELHIDNITSSDQFTFSNQVINSSIPASKYHFNLPKGARLIMPPAASQSPPRR